MTGLDVDTLEKEIDLGLVLNSADEINDELSGLSLMGTLPTNWDLSYTHHLIYDQGSCGSCYSFSATGTLEARIHYKTGVKVSLSQQQAVDCSASFGNKGCSGGLQSKVYEYMMQGNDIIANNEYSYTGRVQGCQDKRGQLRLGTCDNYTIHYNASSGGLDKEWMKQ